MIAKELVTESIPPLKTSDTGTLALKWMNEFRVSHLPIVNHQNLLGVISEEDIMDLNSPDEPLGNHRLSLIRPFVYAHQHLFDVIRTVSEKKLTLVPVINAEEQYMGIITLESLITVLSEKTFLREPGAILVLEMNLHDYSLTEIARIVESNNAKVFFAYTQPLPDPGRIAITLKVNVTELKHIIASLERFNYQIKYVFQTEDVIDIFKDRYDALMKYLET